MKKGSLKKAAAAALSLVLMSPAAAFAGTWEKDGDNWTYKKDDGQYANAANPLNQAAVYGTCYMSVDSFQDQGDYYQAEVTLYDSSFGTNEDFSHYSQGDQFWIEPAGDYGTVKSVSLSAYGDAYMEVSYGGETFAYDAEETWCYGDGSETPVLRKVKENVEVKIPKNISIIPAPGFERFTISLDGYLNNSFYKMTPILNGATIEKLYDSSANYAG